MGRLIAVLGGVVFLLAGCGDVEEDTSTAQATGVAAIDLLASSTQVPSDGSKPATITALVKDGNNTVVEGQPVTFRASSGSLNVLEGTTNASGQATAEIGPGGNSENRTITVTASVGGVESSVDVQVSGTTLTLDGPSSLVSGSSGNWIATLKDSGGAGISGKSVQVSTAQGSTLSSTDLNTDNQGQASFEVRPPKSFTGTETITVQSLGLSVQDSVSVSAEAFRFITPATSGKEVEVGNSQTLEVEWLDQSGSPVSGKTVNFSATRGTLSSSSSSTGSQGIATVTISSTSAGPATVTATSPDGTSTTIDLEFIATQPTSVTLEADPTTIAPEETSSLTAVVRDANNNLVKGYQVLFNLVQDKTGGGLSTSTATTDSQGEATTVFTAGSTTSAQDGVEIEATIQDSTGNVVIDSATQFLTVSGEAVSVVLGSGDNIVEPNDTTYKKEFVVLVTDANGNPVEGAEVGVSLSEPTYYKGEWLLTDSDGDNEADVWEQWYDADADGVIDSTDTNSKFPCTSEDANQDNFLDANEDDGSGGAPPVDDGDEDLEPKQPASVSPTTVTTDSQGFGSLEVAYPQSFATWVRVKLTATVTVKGTQGKAVTEFDLPINAEEPKDIDTSVPGEDSPYGRVGDCTDPN
jgi:hypothetical protein